MALPGAKRQGLTLRAFPYKRRGTTKYRLVLSVKGIEVELNQKGNPLNFEHFDVNVKGLEAFGRDVGGLLGWDPHGPSGEPPVECKLEEAPKTSDAGRLAKHTAEEHPQNRLLSRLTAVRGKAWQKVQSKSMDSRHLKRRLVNRLVHR